jgi:hydroxyacylglutathione hydrolase
MSDLFVQQLQLGPMDNFVYLVGAPQGRECVVIDPAWDVPAILRAAADAGRRVSAAIVTHGHHDHINGLPALLADHDLPIYAQRAEVDCTPALRELASAVKAVAPGAEVEAAGLRFHAMHTPGHTPGAQCLLCEGSLFTGDTLFVGACGRCDLPGSDPVQMFDSLARLSRLDGSTLVQPGHDYGDTPTATLQSELATNPYLTRTSREEFLAYRMRPRG